MSREQKRNKKMIGIIEVAQRLNCHPATVSRAIKEKRPGFPLPAKQFGKLQWGDADVDDYVESLLAEKE